MASGEERWITADLAYSRLFEWHRSYSYDATTGNLASKAGVGTPCPYSCFCAKIIR